MNRMKALRMAVVLAMIAGPLAVWLCTAAYAQEIGQLQGTILDMNGKPYPDVTVVLTNTETGKVITGKTDAKGQYNISGIPGGTYNIDLKANDQVIYQTGAKMGAGVASLDMNLKVLNAANAAIEAKRAAALKQFQDMKAHYDAGLAAINAMKAAQTQLSQTPKDQRGPIQDKINQTGSTAVTELDAAQKMMKEDDPNQVIVLSHLGEAYESMDKWQEAADAYQKSIAMKPDVAANYNNLGNDLAKLGKVDEARAAYQKYVELNPNDAALAWRNFGTVLYNSNRMKEAIDPLQKATTLDPKNAQAWLLLGIALVNTMEFKQEGDKLTPVIQPGTIEAYQKAIELDPNGSIGAQARQGLESLQAMGVGGIQTKVGEAPKSTAKPKGKK